MKNDTIAAVSTPSGEGGIGVVRISGDDAVRIAEKIFRPRGGKKLSEMEGYTAVLGQAVCDGSPLDEVIATVFKEPKSYTGENVVELSCHGGRYVTSRVLRAALDAGARPAEAGEFTKRAFLNGKKDLSEAEAVAAIIAASGEKELRAALSVHDGAAYRKTGQIKDLLCRAAAAIAVFSDYPDDDEISAAEVGDMPQTLAAAEDELTKLLKNYDNGRILREGVRTVIIGRPNVGKSTLMNLLAGEDRSIVSEVAGTTRDVIEETVMLGDIKLCLADTAGLRPGADGVEKLGIERTRKKLDAAELIIAVFDSSRPADGEDDAVIASLDKAPAVAVLNKCDLPAVFDDEKLRSAGFDPVRLSAKTGEGEDDLCAAIEKALNLTDTGADGVMLIGERQRDCAARALAAVKNARAALDGGMTVDAAGVMIDEAVAALMELTGERVTESVADEVFKNFCVGK